MSVPRKGAVLFDSGFVAVWKREASCWMLTGESRAYGTEAELLKAVGGTSVGWSVLEPVALPELELPTEPGFYLPEHSRLTRSLVPILLRPDGVWVELNPYNAQISENQLREYGKLTRLAPEHETAKRILDEVDDMLRTTLTQTEVVAAVGSGRRSYYQAAIAGLEALDAKYGVPE